MKVMTAKIAKVFRQAAMRWISFTSGSTKGGSYSGFTLVLMTVCISLVYAF